MQPLLGIIFVPLLVWAWFRLERTRLLLTLSLEGGTLTLAGDGFHKEVNFASIRRVELDTKDTEMVSVELLAGIAPTASSVGTRAVSRVVLFGAKNKVLATFPEKYAAYTSALELAQAARRFLRAHGWFSADEFDAV